MVALIQRVNIVRQIFRTGVVLKASVVESGSYRTMMWFRINYSYNSQAHEKRIEQVITQKTKRLLDVQEVEIVFDPQHPDRILLRDAYI